MQKLVSSAQMRIVEDYAINRMGIPSNTLMEKAAEGLVSVIMQRYTILSDKRVAVLCGKGNNGGDGFAIARLLHNIGADVTVYSLYSENEFTFDSLTNFRRLKTLDVTIKEYLDTTIHADIIIDAVLGIGIKGGALGKALEAIDLINKSSAFVISVDIPSGLDADSGSVLTSAVRADITVTFGFIKSGLKIYSAIQYTGELVVCDIGIPKEVEAQVKFNTFILDTEDIKNLLPILPPNANKGSAGKVFAVAGSRGMTGAAYMLCEAALRSGAGLVYLGAANGICDVLSVKLIEPVIIPLDGDGNITENAVDAIMDKIYNCNCVVYGPGLGRDKAIKLCLQAIVKNTNLPIVIDADGINALAENIYILQDATCPIILTPHLGEFSRLTGILISEIENNKLGLARGFAVNNNVILILKGANTLIALPNGNVYINTTGNAGMATGGSGDVLSGIIAAFLARGISPEYASVAGVYVHGMAGDCAAEEIGQDGMLARDIINYIPKILKVIKGK